MDYCVIKPQAFIDSICRNSSVFTPDNQEDSQEFIVYLQDAIHEDLNRVDNDKQKQQEQLTKVPEESNSDKEMEDVSKIVWKNYLIQNRSIIVDIFQGQIKSKIVCGDCSYTRNVFEPIMYLTQPIPCRKKKINLYDCIDTFVAEEKSENEYLNCEKCKKNATFSKKIDLWKSPDILIIHLKRFKYSENGLVKISRFVDFPVYSQDLTAYLKTFQMHSPQYYLFAICNHLGTAEDGGHYVTYAYNKKNENWYFFDDNNFGQFQNEKKVFFSSNFKTIDCHKKCIPVVLL